MRKLFYTATNYSLLILLLISTSCSKLVDENNIQTQNQSQDFQEFYDSELFEEVQLAGIFDDSKTFVDCQPKTSLTKIQISYLAERNKKDFDLKTFVLNHFELPENPKTDFESDEKKDMYEHIESLWPILTRPEDSVNNSSLIPLPNPYVVPGVVSEIYYWDSYFTILGLKASGKEELAINMLDNFAF